MEFSKIYNRDEFLIFLRRDFLPDDFSMINEPVVFATKTTYSKQATKLGVCKSLDLVVYEIKHSGKDDPRVGLSKEAFRMLSEEWQSCALVLFVPENNPNNYRFSLIEIKLEGRQDSPKVDRKYSNPRRYSYYLGEGVGGYTPNKYLAKGQIKGEDINDLRERFSVEVLTKAFYNELSDWYAWAVKVVRFPNKLDDNADDDKYNHEAVIRMITRLVFVWFLKQKRLIPSEFFDEQYIANNLMFGFNPHAHTTLFGKSNDSKYYKAILQNLFFAMLNSPISLTNNEMERRFIKESVNGKNSDYDNKKLMRYKSLFTNPEHFVELANKGVPFLNGGLFDCLDDRENRNFVDAFSDNPSINKFLVVPDYLFFGEEIGKDIDLSEFYGDTKKKKVSARGIIDILKRYNFTVEENTPFDQEVSLDPELLGKVFENLLAMYNPETKATARKQTGSFYTPREIVQYMVDESLVAHLKRTVGEKLEEEYRKLMRYTDEDLSSLTDAQKKDIIKSLFDCKILDPACGSGAFPMGVLQQMVHILVQLDPNNEEWKKIVKADAEKEFSAILDMQSKEEQEEAFKDIMKAFDPQINNPDYARKLYLIENCIYGVDIQSIAIQISKLRLFISLVIDQKRNDNPLDNFGIRPLPNLEAKFIAANTLIGLNKQATIFDTPEIKLKEEELKVANHKIFGAKTFKTKTKWRSRVKELRSEISEMLVELGYVSKDTSKLLQEWDMFDQNASSPFFDPEWMFGVSGGFDIVIGNPPYGVSIKGEYRKDIEKYLGKVPDYEIYYYFIQIAYRLLTNCGVLSYIIPNTYLFNTFADKYRINLIEKWSLLEILDCSKFSVFESATVLNTINTWQKCESLIIGYRNTNDINSFKELIAKPKLIISKEDLLSMNQNWGLAFRLSKSFIRLISKIKGSSKCLESYFPEISQGLIAYDKYRGQSAEIIANRAYHYSSLEKDTLKKWLWGGDVNRYSVQWNSKEYIDYCDGIANPRSPKYFLRERVLIREITNPSIFAAITDEELYNDPSVLIVLSSKNYSLKVLVAILNSKLATFYHFNNAPKATKGAFPKILVKDIKEFPLPEINKEQETIIVDLVNKISAVKKADPKADTSTLENKIDLMVYRLYGLTYEEVLTIDPKTSITKQHMKAEYEVTLIDSTGQKPASEETKQKLYRTMEKNFSLLLPVLCDSVYTLENLNQVDTSQIRSEGELHIVNLWKTLIQLQVFSLIANLDLTAFLLSNFRTKSNPERRCNLKYITIMTYEVYKYLFGYKNDSGNGKLELLKTLANKVGDMDLISDTDNFEIYATEFGRLSVDRESRNISIHYDQNPLKVYDKLEAINEREETDRLCVSLGMLENLSVIIKRYALKYQLPMMSANDHYDITIKEQINIFPDKDDKIRNVLDDSITSFSERLDDIVYSCRKPADIATKLNVGKAFTDQFKPLIKNMSLSIHMHFIYLDLAGAIKAYLNSEHYYEKQVNLRRVNIVVYEGFKHIYGYDEKDKSLSFWQNQIIPILETTKDSALKELLQTVEKELIQLSTNSRINDVRQRECLVHYRYENRDNTLPLFHIMIDSNPFIEIKTALDLIHVMNKLINLNRSSMEVVSDTLNKETQASNNAIFEKIDNILSVLDKSNITLEQKQSIKESTEKLKNLFKL